MSDLARAYQSTPQSEIAIRRGASGAGDRRPRDAPERAPSPATLEPSKQRRSRIALIDPRPILREGLAHWLRAIRRGCHVVCFSGADELLEKVDPAEVDVIILSACSTSIGGSEVLAAIEQLTAHLPGKSIIVLSDHDEAVAVAALRRGARGYIPTTLDLPVARAAFELVIVGGRFIPATMLINGAARETSEEPLWVGPGERSTPPAAEPAPFGRLTLPDKLMGEVGRILTSREAEVVACVQQGKSNKVIAYELGMCESTVKVHVRNLMTKLKAVNRTQLAVLAPRAALRRPPSASE